MSGKRMGRVCNTLNSEALTALSVLQILISARDAKDKIVKAMDDI
jgi:hypothetical protein